MSEIIADNQELEVGQENDNLPTTQNDHGLESDAMDAMISVAAKVEQFEKAMNIIMKFVLRQSYAADWISHSRQNDPVHMRSANLSGAGAERIAKSLGIQEKNWVRKDKTWSDDNKFFTYECEADFSLGSRTVHAYGRASSKDKFFGFANGQWKEVGDVKEDDIKMAAFRSCRKEGVRTLLGLRRIPLLKLRELGFSLDLVHYVNFKDAKEATRGATEVPAAVQRPALQETASVEKKKEEKEVFESTFSPSSFEHKTSSNGSPFTVFTDQSGGLLYKWGKPEDKTIQAILAALRDDSAVRVSHTTEKKNDKIYRNIQDVLEVIPQ